MVTVPAHRLRTEPRGRGSFTGPAELLQGFPKAQEDLFVLPSRTAARPSWVSPHSRRAPFPPARAAGTVLAVGSSPRLLRPPPARTRGCPRPGRPCPRSGPLGPPPARTHSRRSAPRQARPRSAAASAMLGSAGGSGDSPEGPGAGGGSASRGGDPGTAGARSGRAGKWLAGRGWAVLRGQIEYIHLHVKRCVSLRGCRPYGCTD